MARQRRVGPQRIASIPRPKSNFCCPQIYKVAVGLQQQNTGWRKSEQRLEGCFGIRGWMGRQASKRELPGRNFVHACSPIRHVRKHLLEASFRSIFSKQPVHLTKFGGGGGPGVGLTCLSVRCLSSYLIFSASSSDQQAAGEARPGTMRRRETRTDSCVSHLTTDLRTRN